MMARILKEDVEDFDNDGAISESCNSTLSEEERDCDCIVP